jgi:hypothetical protein
MYIKCITHLEPEGIIMKNDSFLVRAQPAELQAFKEAAKFAGLSFSAWTRLALRRAAMREFADAGRRLDFNAPTDRTANGHDQI